MITVHTLPIVAKVQSVCEHTHTHDQPIRITNPEAIRLPKSYISCTEFGESQFKALRSPAGWDYYELMKGHDAMITVPTELAQVLKALDK
jgi:hypothetical protein